jgi:hypothetical protein
MAATHFIPDATFERLMSSFLATRENADRKSWLVIHADRHGTPESDEALFADIDKWLGANGIERDPVITALLNDGFAIIEYDDLEAAHNACHATEGDAAHPRLRFSCHGYGHVTDTDMKEAPWLATFPSGCPRLLTENT